MSLLLIFLIGCYVSLLMFDVLLCGEGEGFG